MRQRRFYKPNQNCVDLIIYFKLQVPQMAAKHIIICSMSLIFLLNAFTIKETQEQCVSQKCTDQAAACNDACTNVLYGCWDKCLTNACASLCIGGLGNAAAISVWNCALQKGCSPFPAAYNPRQGNYNKLVTIKQGNLKQFADQTGQQFGKSQLNGLINIINQAANYYGDDVAKNMEYIKLSMDASYATGWSRYNVVVQNSPTKDFGGWSFYCDNGSNYATLKKGICLKNPTWSYLVYRIYTFNNGKWNYLNNNYGRGQGVTADQEAKITKVIKQFDVSTSCSCLNSEQILSDVQNEVGGLWNVICQSIPNTYSYVQMSNSAWLSFKPAACSYLLYTIG